MFLGKGILKICRKLTGEHPCRSLILRHECSPVNLLHIFRTPFSKNTSRWLLQKTPTNNDETERLEDGHCKKLRHNYWTLKLNTKNSTKSDRISFWLRNNQNKKLIDNVVHKRMSHKYSKPSWSITSTMLRLLKTNIFIFMFIILQKPPKGRKPSKGHFQRPTHKTLKR